LIERKPCSDINKAGAVEDKIEDGGECIAFDLLVEMAIPRNGTAYTQE
jgi:hypothetical protein